MSTSSEDGGLTKFRHRPSLKADPIEPLREINEKCLSLLVQISRQTNRPTGDLVDELFDSLCTLDTTALARASRFPLLLVDIRFRDIDWWREIMDQPTRTRNSPTWLVQFPRTFAVKLTRATLVLAWHTARIDRAAAVVLLGIRPDVGDLIAHLHLQDIDRIAERHFRHIRPRWEERPDMWRKLLSSAQSDDADSTNESIRRGIQLMAGEMLTRPTAAKIPQQRTIHCNGSGSVR